LHFAGIPVVLIDTFVSMTKTYFYYFLVLMGLSQFAHAQRNGKIEYYTDSEVKRNPISIGVNYSPFFAASRELNDDFIETYRYDAADARSKLRFGQSYGLDLYIDLGQSFDLVVGVNQSRTAFELQLNSFFSPGLMDSLRGNLQLKSAVTHINIPIHIMLKAQLTDEWSLEFLPQVEFNLVQAYNQTIFQDNQEIFSRNIEEFARPYTTTLGIAVGGNYRFSEYFSYFLRANFRYMLAGMIEERGYARENMYSFGLYTGLRFHF
jgi:hypothetical protein